MEENIKEFLDLILKQLDTFDAVVRKNHYENEQWFLDFQDKLNEISIR